MRALLAGTMMLGLASCATTTTETFVCANGPDISVTYAEDAAIIAFGDGRTEVAPRDPSREGYYAKPGFSWSETAFRSGRLNDGTSSFGCDQSSL